MCVFSGMLTEFLRCVHPFGVSSSRGASKTPSPCAHVLREDAQPGALGADQQGQPRSDGEQPTPSSDRKPFFRRSANDLAPYLPQYVSFTRPKEEGLRLPLRGVFQIFWGGPSSEATCKSSLGAFLSSISRTAPCRRWADSPCMLLALDVPRDDTRSMSMGCSPPTHPRKHLMSLRQLHAVAL